MTVNSWRPCHYFPGTEITGGNWHAWFITILRLKITEGLGMLGKYSSELTELCPQPFTTTYSTGRVITFGSSFSCVATAHYCTNSGLVAWWFFWMSLHLKTPWMDLACTWCCFETSLQEPILSLLLVLLVLAFHAKPARNLNPFHSNHWFFYYLFIYLFILLHASVGVLWKPWALLDSKQ